MVPIYKGTLLSHKKNEIMLFILLEITILSQARQRETNIMLSLICGIKKMVQMNLCTKQKYIQKHRKQTYGYKMGGGKRDKLGV